MTTQQLNETMPDWIQLGLGCDDMTDAFRQSPVAPEHQGVNVMAFYTPSRGSRVFSEVYGLVYGMKSSALHFNRFPALCAATARRMGGAATGSHVDNFTTIDFLMAGGSGQAFANLVINTNGGAVGPEKHKPTKPQQVMLGANVGMDGILREGTVLFEPREETTHKVIEAAGAILLKRSCTPAEAVKLRGVTNWAAGNTFGRIGRLGRAQDEAVPEGRQRRAHRGAPVGPALPRRGGAGDWPAGDPHPRTHAAAYRGVLRRLVAPVDDHGGGRLEGRAAAPRLGHLQPR